jgi:hypothetical protein
MDMRRALLASLVLLLAGCDENPLTGPSAPLDTEFLLAPGESRVVEDIAVRFVRVANDSRCPADAVCVLGGDAQVQIVVFSTGRNQNYDLHTGDMKPVTHEGYTIHLVKVEPYPFSASTIQPDEYRVTLRVTKT